MKWLTGSKANQIHAGILEEVRRETKAAIDTAAWFEYAFKVLTEDEVFQIAESERQPERGVAWFKAFAKTYPKSPRAAQALFLAGFSYAENLKDYARAGALFQQLLETYPTVGAGRLGEVDAGEHGEGAGQPALCRPGETPRLRRVDDRREPA